MRVIGVVDLLHGRAVHARAGDRQKYAPVHCIAGVPIEAGDAAALARAYVECLGLTELYVADLDAILEHQRQDALIQTLAAPGAPLWLDAGISTVEQALAAQALGAERVVVGLETLASYDALRDICRAVGSDRTAFSLDLRNGEPLVAEGGIPAGQPAAVVAARAVEAGAGSVIVIDLARVGTATGLDLELLGRVREAVPGVTLLAGGGVRGLEDLVQLAGAGCDGALVATALHDGRLGAADVAALRHRSAAR